MNLQIILLHNNYNDSKNNGYYIKIIMKYCYQGSF